MKKPLLLTLLIAFMGVAHSQTKLTQSSSDNIWAGNSVACSAGGIIVDNYMIRRYDLDDFGIVDTARLISMEFGVESTTGGDYQVRCRVYELTGEEFDFPNFSLIVSDTADVYPDSSSYTFTEYFPEGYYLLPGDTAVAEIYCPNSTTVGFFLGSNPLLENDTSYLASPGCGFFDPTAVDDFDFPGCHWVMHVWVNQTPAIGTVRDTTWKGWEIYIDESQFNAEMNDPDGDDISMARLISVPANGDLTLFGTNLVAGDTVLAEEMDSLIYWPDPGFWGDDWFDIQVRDNYHWSYDTSEVEIHVINWVSGLEEQGDLVQWEVYPNPIRNELNFSGLGDVKEIEVFDMNGSLIHKLNKNVSTLNLESLPAGLYILEVTDEKGIHQKRFVKE